MYHPTYFSIPSDEAIEASSLDDDDAESNSASDKKWAPPNTKKPRIINLKFPARNVSGILAETSRAVKLSENIILILASKDLQQTSDFKEILPATPEKTRLQQEQMA